MIVSPNLTTYINSMDQDLPDWLENIRMSALHDDVPIIRQEMESFLKVILMILRPRNILEIGTGTGYSALFMSMCLEGTDFHITTIENYEPRLIKARQNLAGNDRISLLEGDASVMINNLTQQFDLIFLDGPKAQYPVMYPVLKRLLHPGGVLMADNVLQDGTLAMSRYALLRRQRTIHERMRSFVREAKHDKEMDTTLLTVGDGVLMSVRKQQLSGVL